MTAGRFDSVVRNRGRRVYGAAMAPPPRRHPTGGTRGAICIDCMRGIDLEAVRLALVDGRHYVHACGRELT